MAAAYTARNRKNLLFFGALLFGSLCLLIPAYYNHFPLMNPDSGVYIGSGFYLIHPDDRPIAYGLFIRLFCVHRLSLWFVIFAQACIVSWLIFRIVKNLCNDEYHLLKGVLTVFILSICSSLSWLVSQVQPDLFTSIAYLCVVLILIGKEDRITEILLYCLFFFSVSVHMSHPFLMVASLVFLLIISRSYSDKNAQFPVKKFGVLILLSLTGIATMRHALSSSKHVFFMGSLLEKGILKQYLADNCGDKCYTLCTYKDAIPPNANEFWWNPSSLVYQMGGWKATKPCFDSVIHDMFTNPKYIGQFGAATIKQSAQQAIAFTIGDGNGTFTPESAVYGSIRDFMRHELQPFMAARQNKTDLLKELEGVNKLLGLIVGISLLVLFYIVILWKQLAVEMKIFLLCCMTGIVFNCLDCAAFGMVNGRYGCKMIWLMPFCVIAYLVSQPRVEKQN